MIPLVKGNTKPDLALALRRGGVAVPLAGVTSVTFKMKKPSGAVLTKSMAITDAVKGKVSLSWGEGDLDESGKCLGEVVVDFGSGAVQNSKYAIEVYVRDEFQENLG